MILLFEQSQQVQNNEIYYLRSQAIFESSASRKATFAVSLLLVKSFHIATCKQNINKVRKANKQTPLRSLGTIESMCAKLTTTSHERSGESSTAGCRDISL